MTRLSIEKLNKFKKKNCYTNKKISEETGIPIATIDRLFSGANKNPTVTILQKVAVVLGCTLDDFFEYDDAKYYENAQTKRLAQKLFDNPELKLLLDASEELDVSDLNAVYAIVQNIKKTKS